MKLKKGDKVKILMGKDRGRESTIDRVFPADGMVLVAGVNQYKRHMKGRVQGQASEIITITKPLHASTVALVCPNCKKPTRVGYLIEKDGKKIRVCRKCEKRV